MLRLIQSNLISLTFKPAFSAAFGKAIEGVVVNHSGACSASA
jgi:hypothetical protein